MTRALAIALAAVPVLALVYVRQLRYGRVAARVGLVAGAGAIVVAGLAPFSAQIAAARLPSGPAAVIAGAPASADVPSAEPSRSTSPARLTIPVPAAVPASPAIEQPPIGAQVIAAATEAPSVVRFRPRDGSGDVARGALLSVRFTMAMDRAATEQAFHATIDGREVSGRTWWAEGDTVLVLDPRSLLPAGAKVLLRVDAGALSAAGVPLARPAAGTFTTARPAASSAATTRQPSSASAASAASASSSGWSWPLRGTITQRFGESLTQYGTHYGLDIDGDSGDPVRSARAGTVTVAGYADECGGIQVRIDHGDGFVSWYRHLSAELVSVGQRVAREALIGRVGATGCATGSHLHFAITRNGSWVDPERYLP